MCCWLKWFMDWLWLCLVIGFVYGFSVAASRYPFFLFVIDAWTDDG